MIIAKSSPAMYSFDFSTYVSNAVPAEGWIDWRLANDVYADFLIVRTNCTTAVTADGGTVTAFGMRGAFVASDDHTDLGMRIVGATGTHGTNPTPIFTLDDIRTYVVSHDDGDFSACGASYPRFTHTLTTTKVGIITVDVHWCLDGGER
jgi:hypothetical protein